MGAGGTERAFRLGANDWGFAAKEQTNFLRTVRAIFPVPCSGASGTSGTRLSNAFCVVPSSCVGARRYQPTRPAAPLACWAPTTEAEQGSCSGSSEVAENRRMAQCGYSYNGSLCNRSNGCLTAALGTGFQPPGCRTLRLLTTAASMFRWHGYRRWIFTARHCHFLQKASPVVGLSSETSLMC